MQRSRLYKLEAQRYGILLIKQESNCAQCMDTVGRKLVVSEETNVQSTANAVKGILEAVPVYQDLAQPATKELGAALQTVAKTVHILLAPVSALVWGYDQMKEFVSTRVAEKLKDVPEERLRSPAPNIAGPALDSLRYTGHLEELRELYAALLATSMDANHMEQAHPAFVEIIRQLSADEAKIIRTLAPLGAQPVIDVRNCQVTPTPGGRWALKNFSIIPYVAGCTSPDLAPAYMDNIQRLGLIEIRWDFQVLLQNGNDPNEPVVNHPVIVELKEKIQSEPGHYADIIKGTVGLTPLGLQFCKACLVEHLDK